MNSPRNRRHGWWREAEGYVAVALAALLFATPKVARWIGVSATAIGVPVFYLILVFGLRGARSRGAGRWAAYLAFLMLLVALIATLVIIVLEIPASIKENPPSSR
jgi:hypothetical protein